MTMLIVEQVPFGGWRHHLARWEACHWILRHRAGYLSEGAFMGRLGANVSGLAYSYAEYAPYGSLQHGYHRLTGFSGRFRSPTNPVRWCDSSSLATPGEAGGTMMLGSCGNGDYDSNGYNGVCRRQAAHILIAEGDTTPSEPFEPSCPKGVSMPSRRLVFITDCLKCGMYRDSSPTAQNDCARREIP